MSGKLFLLIASVCAVQAKKSGDISADTQQKLYQAIEEVTDAKRASGEEINGITNGIDKRIDNTLEPIERDIKLLELKVKIAQKKAKIHKVDITECVGDEQRGVRSIDKDDVRKCRDTLSIKLAHKKLGDIGDEIQKLRDAPQNCAKRINPDKCVLLAIDLGEKRVKLRQREITNLLKLVKPEIQNKCIANGAAKLQTQMDKVKQNWSDCLKKNNVPDY